MRRPSRLWLLIVVLPLIAILALWGGCEKRIWAAELTSVPVKPGESLFSVAWFYGLSRNQMREFFEMNRGLGNHSEVILPSGDNITLPIKRVTLPAVALSVTSWSGGWNDWSDPTAYLFCYTPMFPYTVWGHSDEFGHGSGASFRQLKIGEYVFFSKTWRGGYGDWIVGRVGEIVDAKTTDEVWAALEQATSRRIALVTCRPENGPDARLIIFCDVTCYYCSR